MTYTEYRICEYKLSIGSTNKYSATVTIYVEPLTAFVSAVVLCKTNKKKVNKLSSITWSLSDDNMGNAC